MLWVIFIVTVLIYFVFKLYRVLNSWKNKGIDYIKPLEVIKIFYNGFLRRHAFHEQIEHWYYLYPKAKIVGSVQLTNKILIIREPDIIKQITVKDSESFLDHTTVFTEDIDPLAGKLLVSLKGQRWRNMRATLSPAFTSSKMRSMYRLIKECSEQFTQHFIQEEKKGPLVLEMQNIFTKYTNDVIATSAFGIKCDSLKDPKNEFYTIGQKFINLSFMVYIKFLFFLVCPRLMKALKFELTDPQVSSFFRNIVKTTIDTREREGIIRPDMIHLLMEARKGKLKHEPKEEQDAGFATVEESNIGKEEMVDKPQLTNDDITAQVLLFFIAGFHTSSTLMCFMAHELAINPDIQLKLQQEIDETLERCQGNIDYESILKMRYLDMVISESLRKWPPAPLTERLCSKTYNLELENTNLLIEKGLSIFIPVYSLHHDPKYFPDPEKFDPERFNDENKNNIQPFTYMPFGNGPRNCIGSRFALLEIKALFVHLLSKFDLTVVEKTQVPLKLTKLQFALNAENGFWLGLKSRK